MATTDKGVEGMRGPGADVQTIGAQFFFVFLFLSFVFCCVERYSTIQQVTRF
jgi:hypothetical protein